jgi:hypothetical protein
MKRFLLALLSISWLGLSAQTFETATPTATGVSDAFRNYSKKNPKVPVARKSLTAPLAEEGTEIEIPNQFYIPRGDGSGVTTGASSKTLSAKAPAIGLSVATPAASTMYNQTTNGTLPVTQIATYTGLGNGFNGWTNQGLLPPDTTMAVGAGQIVQWVNIRLTVLNKVNGALLLPGSGYINANQIWQGLPATSVCRNFNQGDPVLQYDRVNSRWILSQFAFTVATGTASPFRSYPAAPYAMCFAVSQSNDATGAFNLYEFVFPVLPDYPKLGLWTDAYYFTSNDFSFNTATGLSSYVGSRVCALDQAAMLAGSPTASSVCFANLSPVHFASLPADFEGTIAPPANAAEYIISNDWFTKNAPPYFVQLRRFHPDFVTPANSTFNDGFGGAADSFVSLPFDTSVIGACGDGGGACVPQPGTTRRLDTLSMRAMYRLAYRNMGSNRESLVFTETVDPVGGAVAGIQLVEIRNPGANPPQIYNNVGFNPDATNRWMGAVATDKLGNFLLGYSVSSSTKFPSIRIAGRQRNDIKSTLRGEIEVTTGSGSQTSSSQRWGDYSTMQIDPDDDCTFWYTQEYMNNTSSANWATQIVGYKFNNCN